MREFLPVVEIKLEAGDGEVVTRRLRQDAAALRIMRDFYYDKELARTDKAAAEKKYLEDINDNPFEVIPRTLFAMTAHERQEDDSPEYFELLFGPLNAEYIASRIRMAAGQDVEVDADPTPASGTKQKSSRTGKRSKPLPKSASEFPPAAFIQ